MLYTYIFSQKFDSIEIPVLCDTTKNWKKIDHMKDIKNIYFA